MKELTRNPLRSLAGYCKLNPSLATQRGAERQHQGILRRSSVIDLRHCT